MSWQSGLCQTPVLAILLMGWVLPFLLMLLVRKNSQGVVEFEWGVFFCFFFVVISFVGNKIFIQAKKKKKFNLKLAYLISGWISVYQVKTLRTT